MEQLKVKELLLMLKDLEKQYSKEEILEMPIYIGDDDELNGIHCGWHCDVLSKDEPDSQWLIEMIDERGANIKFKGKAILIS